MYSANVPVRKDGFPFEMGADTKHSLLWVMGVANLTLTLYILTIVCIFLKLFAIHFLRC